MELVLDLVAALCGVALVVRTFRQPRTVVRGLDAGVPFVNPQHGRFQVLDVGPAGDFTLYSGDLGAEARKVYERHEARTGNTIKFLDNGRLRSAK